MCIGNVKYGKTNWIISCLNISHMLYLICKWQMTYHKYFSRLFMNSIKPALEREYTYELIITI
jgi:hypothetical protein